MILASLTGLVHDHGLYPIFGLMVVAALLPAGSELVMLYGGALASGALAGHVSLFGHPIDSTFWAFVAVVAAGTLGNVLGAFAGWTIGARGGRALVLRYGRVLHADEARLARVEQRLERAGGLPVALLLATPVVRSFVAIPAGISGVPFRRFAPLAVAGCLGFTLAVAGIGVGLGASWGRAHDALRYVEVAVVALVAVFAVVSVRRARRGRRRSRTATPTRQRSRRQSPRPTR